MGHLIRSLGLVSLLVISGFAISDASARVLLKGASPTLSEETSEACRLPLRTATLSVSQWQNDIRAMMHGIEQFHKSPFHFTPKAQLEQAAADLEAQVSRLSPQAIPVRMSQIVALVGDGHTRLMEPPHPLYPLRVYWFGDDLRVTSTTHEDKNLLGGRIKRIGLYDEPEVLHRVRSLVSRDENHWLVMNRTPSLLIDATVLWSLGISTRPDRITIEVEHEGKNLKRSLYAISIAIADGRWIQPFSAAPLYLAHQKDDFWFETLPNTNTVYVIFNHYNGFARHAQELLKYIGDTHPNRLIIDMRENGGGNFALPRAYLLPFIKDNRKINRKGHLYIITGRKTFSAGMSNAADFKNDTNSILVGEPVGERPNSYQENHEFCLPNSHLHLTVSTRYYKFVKGNPEALFPDKRIDISWSDYKRGSDPVLTWILRQTVSE